LRFFIFYECINFRTDKLFKALLLNIETLPIIGISIALNLLEQKFIINLKEREEEIL